MSNYITHNSASTSEENQVRSVSCNILGSRSGCCSQYLKLKTC